MMGKLTIQESFISGVFVISTSPYIDERGEYTRWYCENELTSILKGKRIVNINYQKTLDKGTVRGLHYQDGMYKESKIIRSIRGAIQDVVVDLRAGSPTFMQYFSITLTDENRLMLFVPEGFAHGFLTLTDSCETMYCTTEFYHPECEFGLNPLDPSIGISWETEVIHLSEKDRSRKFIDSSFSGISM